MKKMLHPDPDIFLRWEKSVASEREPPADIHILTSARRRMPAHSRILASMSPVLERILDPVKSVKVIPILGVPCDAVLAFLWLLYAGRWSDGDGNETVERYAMHLLVLSHVYQVKWLKRACEAELAVRLTADTVADVLQIARQCDAAWLCLRCMKLVGKDFATVEKTEGWTFLQSHDPWLELDILQFLHEIDLRHKRMTKMKEEQRAYLQLSEAMDCLLHICTEGCTDVGPDRCRRDPCAAYATCRPLQLLLRHFAKCGANRTACSRCRHIWKLLKLHAATCMTPDSSNCKIPLCRQFKQRMQQMEGKPEEGKWRLLGKKVASVRAVSAVVKKKSLENVMRLKESLKSLDLFC